MGGGPMTPASAPVGGLDAELKLTDKQKQAIRQIQDAFHKEQRALMPGFPGGGPGGPPNGGPNGGPPNGGPPNGGPPNFEQMQANMQKMRMLDAKASKQIVELLTDDQRKALPEALKDLDLMRQAGIPLDILGELKLTADQKSKIAAVLAKSQQDMRKLMEEARQSQDFQGVREAMQSFGQNTHRQVMAVLTEGQRTQVETFIKEHPMRGPGGPGGFGPGGPGGFRPGGPGGPGQGGDGPPPPPQP
jgi:Spy/CpxP family protein refolding chaperone